MTEKKLSEKNNNQIPVLEVAKFFLSLDPKREYFVKEKMIKIEGNSVPTIGNLRLNKLLQITQMLYVAKHGHYLFPEKMWAFEHGGIVYDIYRRFHFLVNSQNKVENLNSYLKTFFTKIFKFFKTYTNRQLEEFVHEDPAWFITWDDNKKSKEMPQSLEMVKYYQNFVSHVVEEVEL